MTHEIIMQLRYASDQMKDKLDADNLLTRAADELEKLTSKMAEMKDDLDSMRRQWCAMVATGNTGKRDPAYCLSQASMVAAANGWDCLNELIDKQPPSQRHFFARVGDTIER